MSAWCNPGSSMPQEQCPGGCEGCCCDSVLSLFLQDLSACMVSLEERPRSRQDSPMPSPFYNTYCSNGVLSMFHGWEPRCAFYIISPFDTVFRYAWVLAAPMFWNALSLKFLQQPCKLGQPHSLHKGRALPSRRMAYYICLSFHSSEIFLWCSIA